MVCRALINLHLKRKPCRGLSPLSGIVIWKFALAQLPTGQATSSDSLFRGNSNNNNCWLHSANKIQQHAEVRIIINFQETKPICHREIIIFLWSTSCWSFFSYPSNNVRNRSRKISLLHPWRIQMPYLVESNEGSSDESLGAQLRPTGHSGMAQPWKLSLSSYPSTTEALPPRP